jgi:hypothetical protein
MVVWMLEWPCEPIEAIDDEAQRRFGNSRARAAWAVVRLTEARPVPRDSACALRDYAKWNLSHLSSTTGRVPMT